MCINHSRNFPIRMFFIDSHSLFYQNVLSEALECECFSPGVIITDIHKRSGMNDKEYQEVGPSTLLHEVILAFYRVLLHGKISTFAPKLSPLLGQLIFILALLKRQPKHVYEEREW